jgi:hypothetical protein
MASVVSSFCLAFGFLARLVSVENYEQKYQVTIEQSHP